MTPKRDSTSVCAKPGCRTRIGEGLFACRPHWFALPADLRRQIMSSWKARGRLRGERREQAKVDYRRGLMEAMQEWQYVP